MERSASAFQDEAKVQRNIQIPKDEGQLAWDLDLLSADDGVGFETRRMQIVELQSGTT